MENVRAFLLLHKLQEIADVIEYYPPDIAENDASAHLIKDMGFILRFSSSVDIKQIEAVILQTAFIKSLDIQDTAPAGNASSTGDAAPVSDNPQLPDQAFPRSIHDLADPRWKGRTGIAKPLFGTTASHVACLFAALGPQAVGKYLDSLKANDVQVHGGNKGCATAVADGAAAFALTDTDDAIGELEAGKPVRIVYPDSDSDGIGTLFLPNTLSVIRGAPHPAEAAELVNYLLSAAVERRLADGPSAQIPLNQTAAPNPRVKGPGQVKAMAVDFAAAAAAFEQARQAVESRFLR